ncbi:hypothetical protein [Nocardiopsis dassonvillei]|uniref:hypothetical protein n=1 Tax=Nocardiopsis dassonvillei TaxID=2014 RepID=UPI00367064CF
MSDARCPTPYSLPADDREHLTRDLVALVRRTGHALAPQATPEQVRAQDLAQLRATELLRAALEEHAHMLALDLGQRTDAPVTYTDLGNAVGITRQAARTRWPSAVADAQAGRPRIAKPDEKDLVMVVYRNADPKVDESDRAYGETGADEKTQREADDRWWRVAADKEPRLRAIVYVCEGKVVRVRGVEQGKPWGRDSRGYAVIPVTAPLTTEEIDRLLPTLGLGPGDTLPQTQGPSRRYLEL